MTDLAPVITLTTRPQPDEIMSILKGLYADLVYRRPVIEKATEYHDGDHPLAFATEKFREAFGGLFGAFADNWCGIVVSAPEERLNVDGFRVDENADTDSTARALWDANEMDVQSQLIHHDSLIAGASYATVWFDDNGDPEITADSAVNTIVACHPKMRRRRTAGLRVWTSDDNYEHAELFLPNDVYLFRSQSPSTGVSYANRDWVPEPGPNTDGNGRMPNPLGVVPVVEFLNRPRLHVSARAGWAAHSEIVDIIPIQDAVNKMMADMLIASEFVSYPQRWVTGFEPTVDEAGNDIPPNWRSGPGRTWTLEAPDARAGAFPAADLGGFVNTMEMVIQHIASISSTPPHYLRASADRLSGESLKSAESGLVAKVRRKMTVFGGAHEQVMRLAGRIAGNDVLANANAMRTVWRNPEIRSDAELADAAVKLKAIGVPDEALWRYVGFSELEIDQFRTMQASSDLLAASVSLPMPGASSPLAVGRPAAMPPGP